MSEARYFPGNHAELHKLLDEYLRGLGERLARQSFAREAAFLLLAGGYGRGEGGVFFDGETSSLYNDLEFYLVVKNRAISAEMRQWCAREAERGEHETGIEVEFKIITLASLERAEPSMFYYDLLAAHVLVFGDKSLLKNLPARLRDPVQIPAHEAARLLFNRGTGLLFCRQALAENSDRVRDGFVERNHAKARLAFADAVLALNGRYHYSCVERGKRLAESLAKVPPNWTQLVGWHAPAVDFKLRPQHEYPSFATLAARQSELVAAWSALFLWLESIRLETAAPSAKAYVERRGRLFPDSPIFKNWLLHARDRVRRGVPPRGWFDYPRAALQKALLLLLQPRVDTLTHRAAASLFALPANAPLKQILGAYERWWRFYN